MSSRISEHPILGEQQKGKLVTFTYDGKELQGYEGEPIAAALKAAGVMVHRDTKKELAEGMKVQTQYGVSDKPFEEQ